MTLDALISNFIRHYNRRNMKFPAASAGTPLPSPDEAKHYLLYLHVPFCAVLCPFCSFHRVRFEIDSATRYFDCLIREIEMVTDAGYRFDELYVGGGTPTVRMELLIRLLQRVNALHALSGISVETNPDDLGKENLAELRESGVTRLSVGVQSFDDKLLGEMQRLAQYGSGKQIVRRLSRINGVFDTLNVDMIFNFPHQTDVSLKRDLEILTGELGVDQVSFYPLMTVESTRKKMLRTMGTVDYARERAYYEIVAAHMLQQGYVRSSAWCFSRKTGMFDEYIVERDEYLGLGSGAFSYLSGSLFSSTFSINHYATLIESGKTGTFGRLDMSDRDRKRYYLLMQMFGGSIVKAAAEERFGGGFQRSLWPELTMLQAIGAIRNAGARYELTDEGHYLWVNLMREFFTGVNNLRDQMRHNISRETAMIRSG